MEDLHQHEEAAKALEIGKKALDAGQLDKAVKMFEKSLRMRKTAEAEALLQCAKKGAARAEAKKSNPEPVTPGQPSAASTPPVKDTRPFTKEQEDACRIIIKAKTHYETLSVEKEASTEEIKKSYRKLALKFHPDKCSAPSADEAFKKISKAFKVLLDPDDRAHYDRYGDREPGVGMQHHHHQSPFQHGDFHDMDPDELLRWFMGGMGGMGGFGPNVRVHHFGGARRGGGGHPFFQQQHRGGGGETGTPGMSLQHLLSLFLMLVFLVSSWSSAPDASSRGVYKSPNQVYSLHPDKQYTIRRKTTMNGVVADIPYYVDQRFSSTIARSPRDLYYVEREVELTLYQSLKEKCQSEIAVRD